VRAAGVGRHRRRQGYHRCVRFAKVIAAVLLLALSVGAGLFDRCLVNCHQPVQTSSMSESPCHQTGGGGAAAWQPVSGCTHDHDAAAVSALAPLPSGRRAVSVLGLPASVAPLARLDVGRHQPATAPDAASPPPGRLAVPLRI